ncbi:hypothetical protein O7626_15585 [Micromonospora sp. WMMD1102]|uniref:hypothetical protein n=1 Tax=Micromonospora sp. WMMD1102 TaxID=3016105 RepID=UPI0024152A1D|nr:hypothetical protein [Micromonospora sp. WMMD1102]MDG4787336.1 hypothetical protein [Micromonospora sp. WMMD1102]
MVSTDADPPAPQAEPPRLFKPLPGRTEDASTSYERCLDELIELLGVAPPEPVQQGRRWQHAVRWSIGRAVRPPVSEEWFTPLIRAAVLEPDPSFNRQLVEPTLAAFGRRRVQRALLDLLRTGSDPERAGAARAWYWAQAPLSYPAGSDTPTPESLAEYDAVADLRREWQDTALRVFVDNENLDVRRCILPGLDLDPRNWPEELRETVATATRIARTSSDDYLRHRVEHQV